MTELNDEINSVKEEEGVEFDAVEEGAPASAATPEKACEVLSKMLGFLGIDANVRPIPTAGHYKLTVESENAGRLIGKRGQTLESLELVFNRVLNNLCDKGRANWISIDVDGYCVPVPESEAPRSGKLPREEINRLEHLAFDIAKEVKMLRKPRIIGPYSPSERRIIHLALENDPDVETVSDPVADAERGKKITVKLKETE